MKPSIAILDYGVGNLYSITRAVGRHSDSFVVTDDPAVVASAGKLILPGVGSFAAGMAGIAVRGLEPSILEFAKTGKPILGICLGAQILMSRGFEFGEHRGLGIIPGDVASFDALVSGTKVPHIGWSAVAVNPSGDQGPLGSLPSGAHMYFVHSYVMKPAHPEHVLSTTAYGGQAFCSAIRRGAVYGTQFHPEKSGAAGLEIIKNFVTLTP